MIEIVYKSVKELVPYARNSRTHSDEQISQIMSSIKEFGFTNPILTDGENGIIAGHGRVMAAQRLGMEEVPTIELSHLTEAQKKAYIIADNKLALNSGWDEEMLAIEMQELHDIGYDLDLIGFTPEELEEMDIDLEGSLEAIIDESKADDVPEVVENPVIKLGDLIELGNHRLLCGDSTKEDDVLKLLDGVKPDFVFADPPYGIDVVQGGKTNFGKVGGGKVVDSKEYMKIKGDENTDIAKDFYNLCVKLELKNILLWGGNYFTDFLYPSRCWVVWDKEMTGNFSQAEMAWTSFTKGGVSVFKFLWNGMAREGNHKQELSTRVHPTQKPVGLFTMIFERFNGFKTIYDGFLGSGSTLIACEAVGNKCYGIEYEIHYAQVIIQRWCDYTQIDTIKINGKEVSWSDYKDAKGVLSGNNTKQ